MMDNLDRWLAREPVGVEALDSLETDVWDRVRSLRTERIQTRLRIVAIVFALGLGAANGGVGASLVRPPVSEMSVFSSASLSPLARLEAG